MVQTFGKRILGGIGAPGGGMSKAYAEGVTTGINQRMNRQAMEDVSQQMRIREQDQGFKIEDREEAKRQRAAAAANAAATRARNIATTRAIAAAGGAGGAGPFWPGTARAGLNVKGAPATKPGALSMGTSVSETPTRTSAAVTRRAKVDVAPTRTSAAPTRTSAAPTRTSAAVTPAVTPATDTRTASLNYDNMPISNIVDVQGAVSTATGVILRKNDTRRYSAVELFGDSDLNRTIGGSDSRTLQLYLEALDPSDPNYSWIVADISEELSGRMRGFERRGRNGSPTASTATTDVQGTYGNQSTIPQRRAAAAANVRAGVQTGLPPEAMTAPVLSNMAARPGDFAAQSERRRASIGRRGAAPLSGTDAANLMLLQYQTDYAIGQGSSNVPALLQKRQELTDRIAAETQARATEDSRWWWQKEDLEKLVADRQLIDAELEAVRDQPSRVGLQTRGMTAEEGPGSTAGGIASRIAAQEAFVGPPVAPPVTIQGPNGPITVPAESLDYANVVTPPIMPPGALPAERLNIPVPASPELGFGGAASPQTDLDGGTTYGGQLGAAPTPTEMFFSDMGYTPAGQLDIQAIMADQRGPMKDPAFSKIAEQRRVMYMYAAEDAIANGDAAGFIDAQQKVKEQEMLILAQQVVAGAEEAINFGSTERLNMAASMIEGVDVVFLPNGDGTVDVYVNEQLDDENIPIESIIDKLRMDVDTAYVEQMATAAAEERKAQVEIYTKTEIDRFETMMNMKESEFAAKLARETTREGEFDKITAKVIEQRLIDSGLLPSTSNNTVAKTDRGIVVISEDGGIVTQYVFGTDDTGKLVEILE